MVDFNKSKGRSKFTYRGRSAENVQKRVDQKGGQFDSVVDSRFPIFMPKPKDHIVRFLPPTWENPDHYGMDIYVHFNVGGDKQAYLCLMKMKNEPCPICEAITEAGEQGDTEFAKTLSATKRVATWIIDRDNEKDGPMIWTMPWTLDKDLAILSKDKRSGEVLLIDHPDDGYDVLFTREGKDQRTKYIGLEIERKPSPIHPKLSQQEKWLEFVADNPIPDCLNYYTYNHILSVLEGRPERADDDQQERPRGRGRDEERPRSRREPEEEERPRSRRDSEEEEERPRGRSRYEEEEADLDDTRGSRSRRRDEEEEEERPRSRRRAVEDEEEEERPRSRRREPEPEEEEERPRSRSRVREEEVTEPEPEEKPSGRQRLRDSLANRR